MRYSPCPIYSFEFRQNQRWMQVSQKYFLFYPRYIVIRLPLWLGLFLALAAVFAIYYRVQTGVFLILEHLVPSCLFVCCILMGFDLLTGVSVLTPLCTYRYRPGVTVQRHTAQLGLVFLGKLCRRIDGRHS